MIKTTLEKIAKKDELIVPIPLLNPKIITPSLTPRPIGVKKDRYPTKRAKVKKDER